LQLLEAKRQFTAFALGSPLHAMHLIEPAADPCRRSIPACDVRSIRRANAATAAICGRFTDPSGVLQWQNFCGRTERSIGSLLGFTRRDTTSKVEARDRGRIASMSAS